MSQDKNNLMLSYSGVDKFHAKGFKGSGIKIVILDNLTDPDKHGDVVSNSLKVSAPDAETIIMDNGIGAWDAILLMKPLPDIVHISMSFFNKQKSEEYVAKGGIVTCATGNQTTSEFAWWEHVIDIGALWENLQVTNYSAKSPDLDLVSFAPYLQREDGSWWQPIGTSFSSPFGAGCIACLLQYWKRIGFMYDHNILKAYLIKQAIDLGPPGKDESYGWGQLYVKEFKIMELHVEKYGYTNGVKVLVNNRLSAGKVFVDGVEQVGFKSVILIDGKSYLPTRQTVDYHADGISWDAENYKVTLIK